MGANIVRNGSISRHPRNKPTAVRFNLEAGTAIFSVMLGLDPSTPTDSAAKIHHVCFTASADGGARVKPEHDESTSAAALGH